MQSFTDGFLQFLDHLKMCIPAGYIESLAPLRTRFFTGLPFSSSVSTSFTVQALPTSEGVSSSRGMSARYAVRYAPTLSTLSSFLALTKPCPHVRARISFGINGASVGNRAEDECAMRRDAVVPHRLYTG